MKEPKVVKSWSSNSHDVARSSIMLTIPADFAREYNLDKPANVLVIPTENGLLIRKLVIPK
jgi:hypothetical protein